MSPDSSTTSRQRSVEPHYVFGQESATAIHLAPWYVVLVCHQYDVCENSVGSVYVGGYGGLSKSGLRVSCKLCPVCPLVVGKGPSVPFQSVVMSYVNCGIYG